MVIACQGRHFIRIPGVGNLLPTTMVNCFLIDGGILHYVQQGGDEAFDQEAPEREDVSNDELAMDEEEEQPQDDVLEDVLYTTYVDIYNLEGSINNMSNLANSLQDTHPRTWRTASLTGAKDGLWRTSRHSNLAGLGLPRYTQELASPTLVVFSAAGCQSFSFYVNIFGLLIKIS